MRLDETQLQAFMDQEYPRQVAALTLIAGSRAAAEDIVQEALARAWARSRKEEQIDSLAAWVTTVSLNLAKSSLRRLGAEAKARRELGHPAPGDDPSDLRVLEVRKAVRSLKRSQREAVVLHYYLGMSLAEVARCTGLAEGSVKTILYRARRVLESELGETEVSNEAVLEGDVP